MKKSSLWLAIVCLGLLHSCKQDEQKLDQPPGKENSNQKIDLNAGTFSNPVIGTGQNPKDPQILAGGDGKFYLIHPNDNDYKVYSSPNLVTWTLETNSCFSKSSGSFWSAGTWKNGSTYNLYYTHVQGPNNRTIGVATSSNPAGPYTDNNASLVVKKDANNNFIPVIDPAVFKDPVSGKVYLYYSRNVGTGTLPDLRVVELTSNGHATVSGTDKQVLTITQDWENVNIEHPLVYYAPNAAASHRYYMLYNGSGGALARYAIGYAYSSSPTGPFTKATEGTGTGQNPITHQIPSDGIYGPGAPNTVVDDAGTRWMIYRIKTTSAEAWNDRAICVDELFRNGSDQLICNPTKGTSQAKPVFN